MFGLEQEKANFIRYAENLAILIVKGSLTEDDIEDKVMEYRTACLDNSFFIPFFKMHDVALDIYYQVKHGLYEIGEDEYIWNLELK